jgi:deazaflavin-dependent oxidoreductase (nitroreductase family)
MPNALVDRSWPLLTRLTGAHVALYRRSGGRLGHRPPGLPPMLLLDHVGARSGVRRTSPLVYTRDGERFVLVASKGGYPRNPAWFYNLQAHPDTTIQVGPRMLEVRAEIASEPERERLWSRCVETYKGFAGYQARAGRTIPLVVLTPR